MAVRVVTLEQFVGVLGKLPGELEAAIVRGLRSAAMRGVAMCVQNIGTRNPQTGTPPAVDEGTLMRSVRYEGLPRGGAIEVDAPHAPYVEMGSRPHWPPLAPLVDWARRKFGADDDEAVEIARAVQAKIARYGTEPRAFMLRTVDDLERSVVLQEVERELLKL